VNCDESQEILSAWVDGEIDGLDELVKPRLVRHLVLCERCREFRNVLFAPDSDVFSVSPLPSLPRHIYFPGLSSLLRWWMIALGVGEMSIGLPCLLGISVVASSEASLTHIVRDGVGSVLLGAILLVTVARPRWAGAQAIAGSLVLMVQALGSISDLVSGRVEWRFEAVHLASVAGVICLWLAYRRTQPSGVTVSVRHIEKVSGF